MVDSVHRSAERQKHRAAASDLLICKQRTTAASVHLSLSASCVDNVFLLRSHQFEERITRSDCSTIVDINLDNDATVTCWNTKEDFLCFNDSDDDITTTKVTALNKGSSIR